jgi:site-specific recombinase XerD
MASQKVNVVFDRKKVAEKRGQGIVEMQVYLSRRERKYIPIGKCSPDELDDYLSSRDVKNEIKRCNDIISAMLLFNDEMTVQQFDGYYLGKRKSKSNNLYKGTDQATNFIIYLKESIDKERFSDGTRKHKICTLEAVKRFGKIRTFADLTPKNILEFDEWLHDGSRTDVSVHTYHKHLRKVTRYLRMADMIPVDPYERVKLSRGKSKERQPLTEDELDKLRAIKFTEPMDHVRDLFIFAAYTGLAYCDVQVFNFDQMTEKIGNIYYIDGERLKTGTKFFTPILTPAMEVLKKYDYNLPKITNQKGNEYLHLIQHAMGLHKSLTFHVARHSFATLAISHGVPIEDVARMLGHEDIRTTQIYAKILKSTINEYSTKLQDSIK